MAEAPILVEQPTNNLDPESAMLKIITILAAATLALPAVEQAATGQHQRGERRQQVLAKFDADKDGKLNETERDAARAAFSARLKEKHPELFARIDTNGDGTLSREEAKAARAQRHERRAKGE